MDLPGGELILPAGALGATSQISRHAVELQMASGLVRYHPIGSPIRIEARRNDNGSPVGRLQVPATVRISLDRPETPRERVGQPALRVLTANGWELVPSTFDASTMALTASIPELPATLAVVDESLPESSGDWDPSDPAALQLSDGAWGVAYVDGSTPTNLLYRRSLPGTPVYWVDPVTVETGGADSPAAVKLDSTIALFYRKTSGTYKQVLMRTSTDDGITWSSATQLTTESASVYQIQAANVAGTVYVFWSLGDTSGSLQYRTSTDLANWTTKASVGQTIGPLQNFTYPHFDIIRLASGPWALAWLNVSSIEEATGVANNTNYPVVLYSTSTNLSSWATAQEVTLPYHQRYPHSPSMAQDSSGKLFLSWTKYDYPWDRYVFHQTSTDDGATWTGDYTYVLFLEGDGSYCVEEGTWQFCNGTPVKTYYETKYGYEPTRQGTGSDNVQAYNADLVVDNNGGLRAFWDQLAGGTQTYKDNYPIQLFYRDLPSGTITPIPATKDTLSLCGPCIAASVFAADPVNVTTGNFTLPETDASIPGRGLGLVFQRTYNATRLVDGTLGYGWTHNYDWRLSTFTHGDVLVVAGSGRSDLYLPAGSGVYTSPVGLFTTLTHNGDNTYTLSEPGQITRTFSSTGKLTGVADRNGNSLALALSYNGDGLLSTVSDPAGRALSFSYAGQRISSVTDPLSRTVSYGYTSGDLTSVVDQRSKTWSYTYDAHRMSTKVDPNSHTVLSNTYGSLGRVTSQRDANNAETKFTYGAGGSTVQDPLGNIVTYSFDTAYRLTSVKDPYNHIIDYYYDTSNNLTKIDDRRLSPTNPNTTIFTYDSRGNVLTRKNDLNNIWTYTYNSFNDVLTEQDPLSHTTTYTYTAAGNLSEVRNAKGEVTSFGRDGYGQLTSVTDGRNKTTTFGYDSYGNVITTTNPYAKSWTAAYDLAGRKTSTTDPLSHTTSFGYDAGDNLTSVTDGRGKVTSYAYDNAGNQTSATDANLKVTAYGYDAKNRLTSVTDAISGTTSYGYDAVDNTTVITDTLAHTRSYTYDKNNRVLTESDALGNTTTYVYDAAGNRAKRTDANGAVTNYTYDAIYRLTSITYPQGTVVYGYNAANLRTSMADATGNTTYAYDELNRLSSVTLPGNKVISYLYDAAGNRTRITYPDGKTVDYGYDDASRMSTVTDWLTKVTSYTYDDAGRLTGTGLPNGVGESLTYNAADQLTSIVASKGGITLTSFAYTLDDAGLRTAVQDLAGAESYSYDGLYRLSGVTYSDAITQTYSYDGAGNRQTKSEAGGSTSYSYDAADRLTAAGVYTYTHDANGNQTIRAGGGITTTYCYDTLDRLIAATDQPACPIPSIRVDAGNGAYIDGAGQVWSADMGFSSGTTYSTTTAIANTTEDALYQTIRYANSFSYNFALPDGTYTVTLKFAELSYNAAGQRKFDVTIEGALVLDDFDIYAAAGGRYVAVDRTFAVTLSDGSLNMSFTRLVGNAVVSAIEIVPNASQPSTLVSYNYRGDGLRYTKTVTTTTPITYTWDVNAGLPVIVQDGAYSYVYGLGGSPISQTDGAGNQSYFLRNGLGSTEKLTDGSGNVVASYNYDVFGAVRSSSGSGWSEYRFTGQQDDAALGMTYLRARYYDTATGRFVGKDPAQGRVTNPGTLNRYTYALNSPVVLVDPSGLDPVEDFFKQLIDRLTIKCPDPGDPTSCFLFAPVPGPQGEAWLIPSPVKDFGGAGCDDAQRGAYAVRGKWDKSGDAAKRLGGVITGFTKHGVDQAINRGATPAELLDAVRNPIRILKGRDEVMRYVGKDAEVRVNQLGEVVTVIRFKSPLAP